MNTAQKSSTAVAELHEEVGLHVDEADLVAFGTLSEADVHLFRSPNGDQLHAFSIMFEVRRWRGDVAALAAYSDYRATGLFQLR